MAKCGIKRYDDLPSTVGLTDVDAIRQGLKNAMYRVDVITEKLEKAKSIYEKVEKAKNK